MSDGAQLLLLQQGTRHRQRKLQFFWSFGIVRIVTIIS